MNVYIGQYVDGENSVWVIFSANYMYGRNFSYVFFITYLNSPSINQFTFYGIIILWSLLHIDMPLDLVHIANILWSSYIIYELSIVRVYLLAL